LSLLSPATAPAEIALKIGGWVGLCQAFNGCSFAADSWGLAGLGKWIVFISQKQPLSDRSVTDSLGCLQVNRHQLGNAALFHGDAEKPVHARHCHAVMGNDKESGVGLITNITQKVTESHDIRIVKRRIHFIKDANWRWIGQKDRKNNRQCCQSLLTAR
jgi:hypothetical protein